MSPEKQKQLVDKYPEIFKYVDDKASRQPIGWGIECADGWYDIIDALCANIQSEVKFLSHDKSAEEIEKIQPRAVQVKEKFGGLRFYLDKHGSEKIDGMVAMAESMSYRTCEGCGVPGKKRSEGWIRVLCDACEEKRKNRKFQ